MIKLRPYQQECAQAVLAALERGIKRQLISLPTGSGKTVVAAYIAKLVHGRTLFLVHRDELVSQTLEKFRIVWPEASVGVVKAERNEVDQDVTIASIQTLLSLSRREQLPKGFGLVVVDEAHHYVSKRWQEPVEHYQGDGLVLGITATARRRDKIALGQLFEEVTYHISMLDLIEQGYLADLRGIEIQTSINLDGVTVHHGEFAETSLEQAINVENRNRIVSIALYDYAKDRKTICFTATIKHAHDLAATMRKMGIKAEAVDGEMQMSLRRMRLEMFRQGQIQVLCNAALLCEGFDQPDIGCILLARPFKSEPAFTQAIGRGARSFPGKEDCLIIDIADSTRKHDLMSLPTLMGITRDQLQHHGTVGRAVQVLRQNLKPAQVKTGIGVIGTQVDLFQRSNLRWTRTAKGWILNLGNSGKIVVAPVNRTHYEVVLSKEGHQQKLHPEPLPVEWAIGVAEQHARSTHSVILVQKDAPWRVRPASERQQQLLTKLKIPVRQDITAGEASDLLDEVLNKGPKSWWDKNKRKA